MDSSWPHAVPQQVMDVEFKLFGAFSLRQFLKILYACIIGFVVYFIEVLPLIIRIGLIGIIVLLGFAFAIVPRLEIKVLNFIKALFISPRYIWIREYKTPEILLINPESKGESVIAVSKSANKKKISLTEELLDEIIESRSSQNINQKRNQSIKNNTTNNLSSAPIDIEEDANLDPLENANVPKAFNQIYERYFTYNQINKSENQKLINVNNQPINNTSNFQINSKFSKDAMSFVPSFKSLEEYEMAIKRLKIQLAQIKGNPDKKEQENQIIEEISRLFNELKIIREHGNIQDAPIKAIPKGQQVIISRSDSNGKNIFGIVVDKQDKPISNATVRFLRGQQVVAVCLSDNQGKFLTKDPLPYGEYFVVVDDNGKHRFNSYKIVIADKNIPGYKLRAK